MLVLQNLQKHFSNKLLFSEFSYTFCKGNIYILEGENGVGKTTLLNLLSQKDKKYSGKIIFQNKEIQEYVSFSFDYVSYIQQDFNLLEDLTVYENITLLEDMNEKKKKKLDYYAKRLKMSSLFQQKVRYLSGGEKQRVAIIRALLKDSDILLADEPTSNLNIELTLEVFRIFQEIKQDKIIIVVTHKEQMKNNFADKKFSLPCLTTKIKQENPMKTKYHFPRPQLYRKLKTAYQQNSFFVYLSYFILYLGLFITGLSFLLQHTLSDVFLNATQMMNKDDEITIKAETQQMYEPLQIDLDIYYQIEGKTILTPYPELLFQYLLHHPNYINYSFYLKNGIIYFDYLSISRFHLQQWHEFYDKNNNYIVDYIFSDNQNIYIDYQTGTTLLLGIEKMIHNDKIIFNQQNIYFDFCDIQKENEIGISYKLAEELQIKVNDQITIFQNSSSYTYKIIKIFSDSLFYTIYHSGNLMQQFFNIQNTNLYYCLLKVKTKKQINSDSWNLNTNLLSIQSDDFIAEIITIFGFYSMILLFFSFVVSLCNFQMNYLKNKKNFLIFHRLGIPIYEQRYLLLRKTIQPCGIAILLSFLQLILVNSILKSYLKLEISITIFSSFPFSLFLPLVVIPFAFFLSYFFLKTKQIIKNI